MNKKKVRLTTLCITFVIIVLSIIILPNSVNAKNANRRKKQIASVKVESGDSLWSIARKYITDDYKDMNEYISEIKKTNNLSTDTIHEGCYIIVPYYFDMES